jgi:ribonuclease HI
MFDMRALKIFIDGSCLKNPGGPGGIALWREYPFDWGRPDEFLESRGYYATTNNRMELRACLFAHEWVLESGEEIGVQHVQVVTDSKYVFENYPRAVWWSQTDWCNSAGREVDNADLWKSVLKARRKIGGRPRVEMILISRRSVELAKYVDRDAKSAARSPQYEDTGFKPGKVGRSRNNDGRAAKPYPAAGEEIVICVYRTQVVRRGVQTIRFQTFSEEKRDFFEKFWARADETIGNSLHRGNAFLVRMNAEASNPRIVEIVSTLVKADLVQKMSAT